MFTLVTISTNLVKNKLNMEHNESNVEQINTYGSHKLFDTLIYFTNKKNQQGFFLTDCCFLNVCT